ncbi:MAG: hypothetical protein ACREAA_17975 [Candidatus Polarisedimenticolia bacterium]
MSRNVLLLPLLLAMGVVLADEVKEEPKQDEAKKEEEVKKEEAKKDTDPKLLPGMSIVGNQEAPKSLVIVPWKSSELGKSLGISPLLDDSRLPVDREVFMRALSYYDIRSESTRLVGAPPVGRDTAAAESDAAQPVTPARRRK